MRLLLIISNRFLLRLLEEVLLRYGLRAEPVSLPEALAARDRPAVLLHAMRWDEQVQDVVRGLTERQARVYLICPEAADPHVYVATLESGVSDAASEDGLALRALALKLRRLLAEHGPARWQLGSRVYVPAEKCLFHQGSRIDLSPTEVQLLLRLCRARMLGPDGRLTTHQLATELDSPAPGLASQESSVRNYITKLRRKLEDDPDVPRVLRHDANGYWLVARPERS